MSRPWLALVIAFLCLPLFFDLGLADLENDEAIYSFAVDRILETGDWLEPKSSPNEDYAFLEKPPLKFWMVAAPIKAGALPHDEFGLRFWDALFGAVAFAYVFAIGSRLISPVCGAVAALLLFVHWPLLFAHGLRTNNMESALLLSYCGGIFHFLEWTRRTPELTCGPAAGPTVGPGAGRHAVATGLYFALGLMTKFVAVAFLPLILGAAALIARDYRGKVVRDWRLWGGVALLVLALCAPWFIWATVQYGGFFWTTILSEAVYRRFTTFLNPAHVQPWSFYVTTMYERFGDTGSSALVIAGLLVLAIQTIRRRSAEGLVVVLWFVLPVTLISAGTSKLYHYAFPFLPPLALAGGYLAALLIQIARAPSARLLERLDEGVAAMMPRTAAALRGPRSRRVLMGIAAAAIGIAAVSLVVPIRLTLWQGVIFKSSGVVRPIAVALVCGALAGQARSAGRWIVPLIVASMLPLPAYRQTLSLMSVADHSLRDARDCVQRVQAAGAPLAAQGLFVDLPDEALAHPLYYYFRRVRPWTRAQAPPPSEIGRFLDDPAAARPMLMWEPRYQAYMRLSTHPGAPMAQRPAAPPMVVFNDVLLLLPGLYAPCSVEAVESRRSH